jgi:hypothetical protein
MEYNLLKSDARISEYEDEKAGVFIPKLLQNKPAPKKFEQAVDMSNV